MANCCKDCDRLYPQSSGSAPLRPAFHQPTMYDHFSNYQKFKQAKDEEQFIKKRKEEILKFNSKFTDWQVDPTSSINDTDKISTQELARFRQRIRLHSGEQSLVDSLGTEAEQAEQDKSLKKKASLLTISRTPVQCPISTCDRTIGLTSVLSHYLRDHSEDFGVQCQEIFGAKRSVLVFDPTTLEFRDNICLGVLAYGGINQKRENRPAERGICMHNAFLPKPHEHMDAHLPILIMASRTSWSAMLDDKELEEKITNPKNGAQHLLVLWLVSVQTTKPIHCTLTVYDKTMTSSRSSIIQVRQLNESQNPSEFLHQDTNCLRLSRGEIDILSQRSSECIHMEVMINEYDQ